MEVACKDWHAASLFYGGYNIRNISALAYQSLHDFCSLKSFDIPRQIWSQYFSHSPCCPIYTGCISPGIKDLLFPKMVACEIKRWGPSGLEDENGMCVLAPNVINQYIFLILWWSLGKSLG